MVPNGPSEHKANDSLVWLRRSSAVAWMSRTTPWKPASNEVQVLLITNNNTISLVDNSGGRVLSAGKDWAWGSDAWGQRERSSRKCYLVRSDWVKDPHIIITMGRITQPRLLQEWLSRGPDLYCLLFSMRNWKLQETGFFGQAVNVVHTAMCWARRAFYFVLQYLLNWMKELKS